MQPRIQYAKVAPEATKAMGGLETYVQHCGLESSLLDLVKLRVSQINSCAYGIDMHARTARAHGETEQRLYALDAWRATPFYTERERAALAWAEAVTRVADSHVPDELYDDVQEHFVGKDLVDLTAAIVAINGWNRFAISFRAVPGSYQPGKHS